MGEKFSEGAIVQHMSKLRQKMVENDLPVPPPLKRGTTVVPSKIYATSGTARRKSMPDTPTAASTTVTTPKPKQGAVKKRNRRSGFESDSDSQPEEDKMDIADTSDEEYGTSGRKKKRQQRQVKTKQATKKTNLKESLETGDGGQIKEEDDVVAAQTVEKNTVKESIETQGPSSRTRGVRPDYSKLEQASDEEGNGGNGNGNVKDGCAENAENEEAVIEDEEGDSRIKSDSDISPRSTVQASPATPAQMTVRVPTQSSATNRVMLTEYRTCLHFTILRILATAPERTRHTQGAECNITAPRTVFQEFHQPPTFHVLT
jgi:hypothetical protein